MRLFLCLAAALLTSCTAASPQGRSGYGPVTGESLVTFGGSLSDTEIDTAGMSTSAQTFTGQVGVGHFITDEHEVGGQVFLIALDSEGTEAQSYSIAPYYNYNFRQSARTWYYVGPHIGLVYTNVEGAGFSEDDTTASIGVHGGVRQWLTPRTSWFVEPRLTTGSDFDDFTLLFGLNFTL